MRNLLVGLLLGLSLVGLNAADRGHSDIAANLLATFSAVNMNQTNTDNAVTVSAPRYIIDKMTVDNCSTSFGASLATLGLYTGAGATGTTVVTPAVLTTLTTATKFADMTLALTTDALTASTLYIRNAITFGSAATCDVHIYGRSLP